MTDITDQTNWLVKPNWPLQYNGLVHTAVPERRGFVHFCYFSAPLGKIRPSRIAYSGDRTHPLRLRPHDQMGDFQRPHPRFVRVVLWIGIDFAAGRIYPSDSMTARDFAGSPAAVPVARGSPRFAKTAPLRRRLRVQRLPLDRRRRVSTAFIRPLSLRRVVGGDGRRSVRSAAFVGNINGREGDQQKRSANHSFSPEPMVEGYQYNLTP